MKRTGMTDYEHGYRSAICDLSHLLKDADNMESVVGDMIRASSFDRKECIALMEDNGWRKGEPEDIVNRIFKER